MTAGAPSVLSCAAIMLLLSAARAFVRPIGPAALSGARWSKLAGASQVSSPHAPNVTCFLLSLCCAVCIAAGAHAIATLEHNTRQRHHREALVCREKAAALIVRREMVCLPCWKDSRGSIIVTTGVFSSVLTYSLVHRTRRSLQNARHLVRVSLSQR